MNKKYMSSTSPLRDYKYTHCCSTSVADQLREPSDSLRSSYRRETGRASERHAPNSRLLNHVRVSTLLEYITRFSSTRVGWFFNSLRRRGRPSLSPLARRRHNNSNHFFPYRHNAARAHARVSIPADEGPARKLKPSRRCDGAYLTVLKEARTAVIGPQR
jgi:hypothetical protein